VLSKRFCVSVWQHGCAARASLCTPRSPRLALCHVVPAPPPPPHPSFHTLTPDLSFSGSRGECLVARLFGERLLPRDGRGGRHRDRVGPAQAAEELGSGVEDRRWQRGARRQLRLLRLLPRRVLGYARTHAATVDITTAAPVDCAHAAPGRSVRLRGRLCSHRSICLVRVQTTSRSTKLRNGTYWRRTRTTARRSLPQAGYGNLCSVPPRRN
jgi:hypothetical protein